MKHSKKGITLVELVICCAIIVMLGGACTAVLASGSNIFYTGSATANAQLDAEVMQNILLNTLPSVSGIQQVSETDLEAESGIYLYISDNELVIRNSGKETTVHAVTDLAYQLVRAGASDSSNARAQLTYTATLTDGNTLSGGMVLTNVTYSNVVTGDGAFEGKLSENPLGFN